MENKEKTNSNLIIIVPILVALIACVGTIFTGTFSEIAKALLNPSVSMTNSNPVDEAVIKFVVVDKSSSTSISGATIILQIDVMPSETNVTDTDGVARFFLKPESIGLHGFLQIEADGYKSQKRDIDIDAKKPLVIYLEKENSTSKVPTLVPTFTPVTFFCPQSPEIRMAVGDKAKITPGELSRLRSKPESGDNVIDMLGPKTEIQIIGGPICYPRPSRNDSYVYWKVYVASKSLEGWLAEGDFDHYYIEPVP